MTRYVPLGDKAAKTQGVTGSFSSCVRERWRNLVLSSATFMIPRRAVWRAVWKYGKVLAGLVSAISSAILAFTNLAQISLEARFILVGATAFVTVAIAWLLLSRPTKPQTRPKLAGIVSRCLVLLLLCWLVVKALGATAVYHNVRVFRQVCSQCPNVGSVEIQPPRFPVQLTINVSVPQAKGVMIEQFFPASWNREDPVNWQERNRTKFQDTLLLSGFKTPQVFGIWYQLNRAAGAFSLEAIPAPENVRVLEEGQLRRYRKWAYVYGGALWLIGVCFWFLRWF